MYGQSVQTVSRRRNVRYYGNTSPQSRRGGAAQSQTQARLVQLAVCLVLFLTIFLGKGVFPGRLERLRDDILTLISTDLDFRGALAGLGESLTDGDTMLADFGTFCVEVFGGGTPVEEQKGEQVQFTLPMPKESVTAELQFLIQDSSQASRTAHYAALPQFNLEAIAPPEAPPQEETQPEEPAAAPEEPPAVPAAGTVIAYSDYSGEALPENYTMDRLSLGGLETVTPVMGRLTSTYGYREHPILDKTLFHGGVDIGGQEGEAVAAFAGGKVEYTGENDSYGLYLQVDHGNGVKSFYAHCSKIVVKKGQTVAMGEKLAEIGSTGISTGPHLHLELKYGKMHLNPAYYVEFSES